MICSVKSVLSSHFTLAVVKWDIKYYSVGYKAPCEPQEILTKLVLSPHTHKLYQLSHNKASSDVRGGDLLTLTA